MGRVLMTAPPADLEMNRQATVRSAEPLREYGYAPVFLFFYVSFVIILKMLLVGYEKKTAIAC